MPITPVADLVAAAKARVRQMSVEEARTGLADGTVLLVDIRDIRELDRDGRIPSALHAPRGMLEFWIDPASPYHRPVFATDCTIVLFCAMSWRSALAAAALQDMGVENIADMDGGFQAWVDAGAPVERRDP
ncbi:MAG: rhodanese-like domain-containing protein [Rhodobacteraceae bacterium]|jgi:rhodanese-related sulfurtransferase|nr:rhodanese-like domain-containing protein [Paracoccaceae bacterium]